MNSTVPLLCILVSLLIINNVSSSALQVRKELSAYWPTLADEIPWKLISQKAPPAVSPFLEGILLFLQTFMSLFHQIGWFSINFWKNVQVNFLG